MSQDTSAFDDDYIDDGEMDEHEYEFAAPGKRNINRRRIEILKEQLWLKQQLNDFYELPE